MINFPQNSDIAANKTTRRWLFLGVWALAIAGLFSLVLVVARTPSLSSIPLFNKLFHTALVVHVDLSVLVWFLSIACMFWSMAVAKSRPLLPYIEEAAQICFALGMVFIAAAPFDTNAEALMSNYIPVLTSPLFFIGLSLLACGVLLMVFRVLSASQPAQTWGNRVFEFAAYSSALITLIALVAFFWSFQLLPPEISGQQVYELGFWGGGHILQFVHTQILLLCWLWLAHALKPDFAPAKKFLYAIFAIGLLAAFASPIAYILYDVTSMEFRNFFTDLMIAVNGVSPILLAFAVVPVVVKAKEKKKNAIWAALGMSVLLFLYGGFLAGMIRGQNVVIPAHYHGSIVGITLAFMGIAYLLLPHFGYRNVEKSKLAFWQPFVYGGGQLLHITGLAWSGGYGVLRKTPGAENEISASVKAAMGMMGLG